MDAVTYLKEKGRLTKHCSISCEDCRLGASKNKYDFACDNFEQTYPEETVEAIRQWGILCPEETYKTKFLNAFPNAELRAKSIEHIGVCVYDVFKIEPKCLTEFKGECEKCWD